MIRIVRLTFKQQHIEDFMQLFTERKQMIRDFEGCTHLELWQDKNDARIFYTYSLWEHHDHLDNYRISDLFRDTWSTVKTWFDAEPFAFSADKLVTV